MPAMRIRSLPAWAMLVSAILLSACGSSTDDPMRQQPHVVRGMAVLEPPLVLSTGSSFQAELIDLSEGPDGIRVVAIQELKPAGQSPLPIELRYDPAALPASAELAVRATVQDQGEAFFVTAEPLRVDQRLASEVVELRLRGTPAAEAARDRLAERAEREASPPPVPEFQSEVPEDLPEAFELPDPE